MITKRLLCWVIGLLLVVAFVSIVGADNGSFTNTVMRPDRETRLKWMEAYEAAPSAAIDRDLGLNIPFKVSISLLSLLNYIPSERDQGACNNCWAWAGTGIMEIALSVQEAVFDRLSIEFISSCNGTMACCEGGWLDNLTDFYSFQGYAIPWSNTNAAWQNGDGNCNVLCDLISTTPNYAIASITPATISTHGVGKTEAIAHIKNILNQGKAIFFGFFMGTSTDWINLFSFWNNESESGLWDFDASCGKVYTSGGGGHAVLCVGYNDDDPNNAYWIMVNSWGTTAKRPNGIFRVDMDMDYDCYFIDGGYAYYSLYWQTLNVDFDIVNEVLYVEPSGSCGGNTPCFVTIREAIDAAGSGAAIRIAGERYDEAVGLSTPKVLTLQGGWDVMFTSRSSSTTINSLTVGSGTVNAEYLVCQ